MLLGLSTILTAAAIALREPMLMFFGASEQTFPYANSYLTYYVSGTVFAILTAGLGQFITCQGFANEAMLSTIIGAVMNIILDPIFIFLFNMGVRGAAIATVISQACSCAFVLWFLFSDRVHVKISFGGYSAKIMRRVLTFGFCPFIIIAGDSVLIIALNTVLQQYGGAQGDMLIACATIVLSYMQIVTLPLGGITSGTQPILSFNYGAQNIDRIRKGEKEIVKMAFAFCLVMFIISQTVSGIFCPAVYPEPGIHRALHPVDPHLHFWHHPSGPAVYLRGWPDGTGHHQGVGLAVGVPKGSVFGLNPGAAGLLRRFLGLLRRADRRYLLRSVQHSGLFEHHRRVLRKRQEMPEGQSLYS